MSGHGKVKYPKPDPKSFRDCVGEFATGVTVVTVEGNGIRAGMTLNSFTSVSLEPLLILVSLAHSSRTRQAIEPEGRFAVNMLRHSQASLAVTFSRPGQEFPEHQVAPRDGWLIVRDSLAVLLCDVEEIITAGDHDLVLGRVVALERAPGEPLVFHRGRLGGLKIDGIAPAGLTLGGWEASENHWAEAPPRPARA
jgi:flavin reductase (DIM6/NTAB) family NADH-FMN oxidoreductase RutF